MSKLLYHADNGGIVTLTINRPEVHNAFDDELICSLTDSLLEIERDPETRVVILTGSGESFSAGADLAWMRRMAQANTQDNEHDALLLARLLRTLNYLAKPTIARVNGAAYGGGLGLLACCDITVAVDTAVFALTECRLGLAPAIISPYVYRKIGESLSRRYFLTGERFDALHARRIGLLQDIVPAGELDGEVARLVGALLKGGPNAQVKSKKLAQRVAGHDADAQLELDQMTARLIAELRTSTEGREGMAAFMEKRKPAWQGDT